MDDFAALNLCGEGARRPGRSSDGRRIILRDGRILMAAPLAAAAPRLPGLPAPTKRVLGMLARGLRSRAFSGSMAALPMLASASLARAQAIVPLVPPTLDPVYNRGRNIGVDEQYDPAYQPLGLRLGSILAYPSVGVVTGATNNVYTTNAFKRSDAYYFVQPVIRITTDLPRHNVDIVASADFQRYAHEEVRNQNNYALDASGRLDIGPDTKVTARLQYTRASESPYASDLAADVSVLSLFTRVAPSVTAVHSAGRTRLMAKVEQLDFNFNDIVFTDGSIRDQSERDRKVQRGTAQAEYALSPSMAAFTQITYETTDYKNPLRSDGQPNRDSKAYIVLAGVNFDLAGLMRGSVGGGYTKRDYDAAFYENSSGFILQAQAEFFISPLTTVGLGAQRTIQDSSSSFNGAYSDTRESVNVDHALLRNLILSAGVTRVNQKLLDTRATSQLTLARFSAKYQSNRFVNLSATVQYGRGRPGELPLGTRFDELRGQVSLRLRR